MNRTLVWAAGAVLVFGGAVWMMAGRGRNVAGTPDGAPVVGARDAGRAVPSSAPDPAMPPAQIASSPDRTSVTVTRFQGEVAAAKPATAAGETFIVLVLDKATDRPVEGATVVYLVQKEAEPVLRESRSEGPADLDALVDKLGHRVMTDVRGEAGVPQSAKTPLVWARFGDRSGSAMIGSEAPSAGAPVTVRISAQAVFRAQVVDAAGAPVANMPVALRDQRTGMTFARAESAAPDGMVSIRLPAVLQGLADDGAGSDRMQLELAIVGLGIGGGVAVSVKEQPAIPPRLVVPPVGRHIVLLTMPDGTPVTEDATLNVVSEDAADSGAPNKREVPTGVKAGRVDFARVGLQKRFRFTALLKQRQWTAEAAADGPKNLGDTVTTTIQFEAKEPFIVGRLVDGDGAPVVHTALEAVEVAEYRGGSARRRGRRVTTDDKGRFRISIETTFDAASPGAQRHLTLTGEHDRAARIDAARVLPPGDTDIGDVRFAQSPLVCAGAVVDAAGEPVAGAAVRVSQRRAHEDNDNRPAVWDAVGGLTAATDRAGHFALRGILSADSVAVSATKPGWLESERAPFTNGSENLRVVLMRAGAVEGRVILDPGVPPGLVRLRLERESAATTEAAPWPDRIDEARPIADGSFSFTTVIPGIVKVSVDAIGIVDPLLVAAGIAVKSGETARDPRLNPLDLRGKVKRITVTVVDSGDRPVPVATVIAVAGATATEELAVEAPGGKADLLIGAAPVDLSVTADGFRSAAITGVTQDCRVVLRGAISLTLRLDGVLPALEPDMHITANLMTASPPRAPLNGGEPPMFTRRVYRDGSVVTTSSGPRQLAVRDHATVDLNRQGVGTVRLLGSGTFAVTLMLYGQGAGQQSGVGIAGLTPTTVTVADTDADQTVSVPAPETAAIKTAVDRLNRMQQR